MVSVAVGVAGCEVRTHQSEDDGKSQRQEDRRGALAVESGPPMRGSGGIADRLGPLLVDACGLCPCTGYRRTIRRIRLVWGGIPHRVPCLFAAGRLLGSSWGVGPLPPRNPARQLTSAAWEVP